MTADMGSMLEGEDKEGESPAYFRISGILIATLVGGFWAGAFLLYRNYKAHGEVAKAKVAAWMALPLQIASWSLGLLVPPDPISLLIVFLPQLGLAAILLYFLYRPWITQRLAAGASAISGWTAFKFGFFFFLADRALWGLIAMFMWIVSGHPV